MNESQPRVDELCAEIDETVEKIKSSMAQITDSIHHIQDNTTRILVLCEEERVAIVENTFD